MGDFAAPSFIYLLTCKYLSLLSKF